MEDKIADEPIEHGYDWLKNRHDTEAITLRLKKSWIGKLNKLAYQINTFYRLPTPFTKQLIIQQVIERAIIRYPMSELLKRYGVLSERQQLEQYKKILKQQPDGQK